MGEPLLAKAGSLTVKGMPVFMGEPLLAKAGSLSVQGMPVFMGEPLLAKAGSLSVQGMPGVSEVITPNSAGFKGRQTCIQSPRFKRCVINSPVMRLPVVQWCTRALITSCIVDNHLVSEVTKPMNHEPSYMRGSAIIAYQIMLILTGLIEGLKVAK